MDVDMHDFKKQVECEYKGERYSVRDNGAVLRYPRKNKPLRKWDNKWTLGTPNNKGYCLIASEVVHRIVAFAFLGKPPTPQHIVDHKDTNRQNNRPENLRWLTKLENILNNPITLKKIEFLCGSVDAFLKDPSILKDYECEDQNFGWMKAVTPEEAKESWNRLSNWAEKDSDKSLPSMGKMGEWIFSPNKAAKISEKERIAQEQSNHEMVNKEIEVVLHKVENDTGLSRDEYSIKSKKRELLSARVYAAVLLRDKVGLSEEGISKLIGVSKSMVNTYLNYPGSYINNADYYKKYKKELIKL